MSATSILDHYLGRLHLVLPLVLMLLFVTPVYATDTPYVVQPGDTLSEIAKSHGTDVDTLRRLNGLGDVDFVWVGQQLQLPAPLEVVTEPSVAPENAATDTTASAISDDAIAGVEPSDSTIDGTIDSTSSATSNDIDSADDISGDDISVDDISVDEQSAATTESPDVVDSAVVVDSTVVVEPIAEDSTSLAERTDPSNETGNRTSTLVDPADLAEPVVSSTEITDIYIVAAGDTLSQIAVRYRTTLAHLIEFNQISPAQRLKVGQALVVPVAGESIATVAAVAPVRHVVQPGEALSTIAKAYDLSTAALARANGIANTGFIVPGQELTIPSSTQVDDFGSTRMGSDGYHVHTTFPTSTEKWIDVDLSEQRLVAYRGHKPVKTFIISSGLPGTPTVTGNFRIWAKTPLQDMYAGNRAAGYSYYIKDVPWVQYFYKDYGFHGAYWHNNFGHPMSHGCINMRNEDAQWLFEWASPTMTAAYGWFTSDEENPGTLVVVHD